MRRADESTSPQVHESTVGNAGGSPSSLAPRPSCGEASGDTTETATTGASLCRGGFQTRPRAPLGGADVSGVTPTPALVSALITDHTDLGNGFHRLTLHAPELAAMAVPGQFVHLRVAETQAPLLRRPMSIHQIDHQSGTIRLLYRVVGAGTEILAQKRVGESLDLLGPLGKGFPLPAQPQTIGLVAGGMGVAPLLALAEELSTNGHKLHLFLGARDAQGLLLTGEFTTLGAQIHPVTEDGSVGQRGRVTDHLPEGITEYGISQLYACGPTPMLRAVQAVARQCSIPAWLSLEAHMACGLGACLGCTVKVREGDGWAYRLLCQDGPVLDAEEVIFSA